MLGKIINIRAEKNPGVCQWCAYNSSVFCVMQGPTLQHKHVEIARPLSQRICVLEEEGMVPSVSCCIPEHQSQTLHSFGPGTPSAHRGGLRANTAQPHGVWPHQSAPLHPYGHGAPQCWQGHLHSSWEHGPFWMPACTATLLTALIGAPCNCGRPLFFVGLASPAALSGMRIPHLEIITKG